MKAIRPAHRVLREHGLVIFMVELSAIDKSTTLVFTRITLSEPPYVYKKQRVHFIRFRLPNLNVGDDDFIFLATNLLALEFFVLSLALLDFA